MLTAQSQISLAKAKRSLVASSNATLLDTVMRYQNPDLVLRLQEKLSLSKENAELLFEDTKKFLFLCGTTTGRWSPTEQIDEGWHNFILFTKDYQEFCHEHFGRLIHHNPKRLVNSVEGISPQKTAQKARHFFGDGLSKNWAHDAMRMSTECSKSGCDCSPDTGGGGSDCTPDSD